MSKSSSDIYIYYLRNAVNEIGTENALMVFGAEKEC